MTHRDNHVLVCLLTCVVSIVLFTDLFPLIKACKKNQYGLAKELLERGIQEKSGLVDLQDSDGRSALMHACERGHTDVAKLLLDHKADVDLQSLKWECALS